MKRHLTSQRFCLIGACMGLGAQNHDTRLAPEYLKKLGLAEKLELAWEHILYPQTDIISMGAKSLEVVSKYNTNLCCIVQQSIGKQLIPVIIGGDHSVAIGTWSGVTIACNIACKMGLIWLDAHLDAHTHQTSPSNAIHGMPVASLLGYGHSQLINIGAPYAKISPDHLVIVGARSYEIEEHILLKNLGVKIFYIEDVKHQGLENIMQQAFEIVGTSPGGFGLSVDLDVFDPQDFPGVGSPEKNGISMSEALKVLKGIGYSPNIKAIEIVELNPNLDHNNISGIFTMDLLHAICT